MAILLAVVALLGCLLALAISTQTATASERSTQVGLDRLQRKIVAKFGALTSLLASDSGALTPLRDAPEAACRTEIAAADIGKTAGHGHGTAWSKLDRVHKALLQRTCEAAAWTYDLAVIDRHAQVAHAKTYRDIVDWQAWEVDDWLPPEELPTGWIDDRDASFHEAAVAAFRAAYDSAEARIRAAAAFHGVLAIRRAFANDRGADPHDASLLCSKYYPSDADYDANVPQFGLDYDAAHENVGYHNFISARGAAQWIRNTCLLLHGDTIRHRVDLAWRTSGIPKLVQPHQVLRIRAFDGETWRVDPEFLIKRAAVDGLQIAFVKTRWFDRTALQVAPFGRQMPGLIVHLRPGERLGRIRSLEIEELPRPPGAQASQPKSDCTFLPSDKPCRLGYAPDMETLTDALDVELTVAGLAFLRTPHDAG